MRLIGKRTKDAGTYALPTTSEVAALIVGDLDPSMGEHDIVVESKSGVLKRISELNPAYLPLQYPILFPYGEDGFREDIHFATHVIYTIEFQKRGLPHAHILLFLQGTSDFANPAFMDRIISAEIPDKLADNEYYKAVEEFMLHGPCGVARSNSPCMVNGKCSKHFPKRYIDASQFDQDGYPLYRRRDDKRTIKKNGIELDNRYVVPHNRYLLLKYKAHINVEWCNQSRSIKYLFKYVNKDNDRVTAEFYKTTMDEAGNEIVDEINMYYDCRYISACEAAWRLFSFEVQYRTPPVERLSFHLPDCQSVVFQDDDTIDHVLNRETVGQSMFNAWFVANQNFKEASLLTYIEMPTKFVWKKDIREWHPRKKGFSIGRIFYVPPASGEIYYLRCLLNIVRGPKGFQDIRTVNGVEYLTFRDACYAHGLLDDDKEYIDAINEARYWSTAHSLRKLFVVLLTSSSIIRPENVWNQVWQHLCEDAQHYQKRILKQQDLVLTEDEKKNFGLFELENLLGKQNKSLKYYPPMPIPTTDNSRLFQNHLVFEELCYNREQLKEDAEVLCAKLTEEQSLIYDTVIQDIADNKGGLFFCYGYGGTGKTFLWRALSAAVRCKDSTCNIKQCSDLAELLIKTSLIIWDEAPMMHKHCFEVLDRTMRDFLRFVDPHSEMKTFGGKTVVLRGDFCQILHVVPKGTRQDIVSSAINSSYLWDSCKVLRLTKNLRLSSVPNGGNRQALQEFADWIANVGDGKMGGRNDGFAEVEIPKHMLLSSGGDDIKTIVHSTFPMFANGNTDPEHLLGRAILAPTLDVVNAVNDYMTELHNAESRSYYSSDAVCKADGDNGIFADVHTPEFLNSIKVSGLPNHTLTLKIGSPVMLMRNIDHSLGL
ncbi:PREDICTED: uncharacterized protein LOC109183302 [Ipomoea nil]|uniref:uncharacterized protein LOC109183302 n=1 Tax=Ipomoea nil TaxID=35883 RepID=UPI000901EB02|nr:PREDICTED: uncharacterized protein LOC109183302 [Ipomoea nil]